MKNLPKNLPLIDYRSPLLGAINFNGKRCNRNFDITKGYKLKVEKIILERDNQIMQTIDELEERITFLDKELINLDYELLESLNEPEIDSLVRVLRTYLHTFQLAVVSIRNSLREKIQQQET